MKVAWMMISGSSEGYGSSELSRTGIGEGDTYDLIPRYASPYLYLKQLNEEK